jgi:hypothetical protein
VLFIDELASVMLDPDLKKEATRLLADITARGRAPGIHVVLATQRPEVKVVDGQIKGNIDARLAFRVTDNASSMVILDNTDAARFTDNTPPGRFIYRSGLEKDEVQAPLITADQIKDVLAGVLEGDEREISRMSPEAIFKFAIDQLNGKFGTKQLYPALQSAGHDVSYTYLERLSKEYEGDLVEVDGALYELKPHAGPYPRRFVPAGTNGGSETPEG